MAYPVLMRIVSLSLAALTGGLCFAAGTAGNSDRPAPIDREECSKKYQKTCSGRKACDEQKEEFRQCKIRLQAALDRQKERAEADYRASKQKELEAMSRVNEALSKTQKLNGSKH